MKTSEQGLEFIKSFESLRLNKYNCPAGYSTIGYGHVINPGDSLEEISYDNAQDIFKRDILKAEYSVKTNVNHHLLQHQFDALVSFVFNLGGAAFQRSTLRQKINRGEFEDAIFEFKRWVKVKTTTLPGLVRRRAAEACIFAYGKYQNN